MRVAQVVTRLDFGGVSDIYRILCEGIKDEYDVTLVIGRCRDLTPATRRFLVSFRKNIIWVPVLRREINPFFDIPAFIWLWVVFLFRRFDIVHTHTAKAGILGRLAAKAAGVKRIVHMPHGHNFYGYFNRGMSSLIIMAEKFAAAATDKLIALTELEKNDYACRGVISKDRITVVPSGQELDEFVVLKTLDKDYKLRSLGLDKTKKIVSFVGRLASVKGPDLFIKIAERMLAEREDVIFLLVGDGPLREILEQTVIVKDLRLGVRLLGWCNDAMEIICVSDAVCAPSRNEAVGRTLIEAQLLGVPVAASRVGGIPEIVEEGETGDLFCLEDIEDAVRKLNRLLNNEQYRKKIIEQAKKHALETFSAEVMIKKIKATYE